MARAPARRREWRAVRGMGRRRGHRAGRRAEAPVVRVTRTQHAIGQRMAEAQATNPLCQLRPELDVEGCVALRPEVKRVRAAGEAIRTYHDMVVKGCAVALRGQP